MKTVQVWECWCGETYKAPIPVQSVMCGRPHAQGKKQMKLVEGVQPVQKTKATRKKVKTDG